MEYVTILLKLSDNLPVRKIESLSDETFNGQLNYLIEFIETPEGQILFQTLTEKDQQLITKLKQRTIKIRESSNFFYDSADRQDVQPSPVKPRTDKGIKSVQINYIE
ncbi:hypothetical protein SS50377_27699 [Spironucleus salmonicida]|uniref:Uncharacterized protein n=1 Tax=Spironucleus salmonicida TaxID=348837 RepID=V6LPI8_9EUKA|nr:hypothetical protein SS50377_27699 [Spironucleus salmonicida]|eukprot:EST46525.1 Hypothetical protein SS50377_13330 [Spironucleus salmonicida]